MVSIPEDGGECVLFSGIFGMTVSFGFLKRIISGKIQRRDNYEYENNGLMLSFMFLRKREGRKGKRNDRSY